MPPQTNKSRSRLSSSHHGRHAALLVLILLVLIALLAANIQALYDWYRLRGYTPPADVATLSSNDELTSTATHVFYVNHPALEDKTTFSHQCPNGGKEAAVLGCYLPSQRGIYVLRVNDLTLTGIEQVTAAHELLHAEYDRLDSKTKKQVDAWLMDYYQHYLHDQNIIDQMNIYKKTEPNDLFNEMHSVFGTEVTTLPGNLENYYRRYFYDRSLIATYYAKYENEFTSRINQIKQNNAQLSAWKVQIESLEQDIKGRQGNITRSQQQLQSYSNSGNITAYNAGVSNYNAEVNAYNSEVAEVQSLVQRYNQLLTQSKSIALEEQQLVQDITVNITPISK